MGEGNAAYADRDQGARQRHQPHRVAPAGEGHGHELKQGDDARVQGQQQGPGAGLHAQLGRDVRGVDRPELAERDEGQQGDGAEHQEPTVVHHHPVADRFGDVALGRRDRPCLLHPDQYQREKGCAAGRRAEEDVAEAYPEAQGKAADGRSEDDTDVHGRADEAVGSGTLLLREHVGDHRVTRGQEERPAQGALQYDEHADLPGSVCERESHEPDDPADGRGDHGDSPSHAVRDGAAHDLERRGEQTEQAEQDADREPGGVQMGAQVDAFQRESQARSGTVDEGPDEQDPDGSRVRSQGAKRSAQTAGHGAGAHREPILRPIRAVPAGSVAHHLTRLACAESLSGDSPAGPIDRAGGPSRVPPIAVV